jgi:hypothetical protein
MEHAKRMVLVDEKMLDGRLWQKPMEHMLEKITNKQDLHWKRPTEHSAKSLLSKQMKSVLNLDSVSDDVRAKQYQQSLNRFLHTDKKLPDRQQQQQQPLIDFATGGTSTSTVDDLLDLKLKPEKKPKKARVSAVLSPMRKSKRLKKKTKFQWEDY